MASKQQGETRDEEPTTAELREKLLEIVAPLKAPYLEFLIQKGVKQVDGEAMFELVLDIGDLYVTSSGTLFKYDGQRGVYVNYNEQIRNEVAVIGQHLSEQKRLVTLALEAQPRAVQRPLEALVPKVVFDRRFVDSNVSVLKDLYRKQGVVMNGDCNVLNFRNGLLDLSTMVLTVHTAGHYSSIQLPFDYDPNAECPTWERYLEQVLPDLLERLLLQEFVGHLFEPSTRFEVVVFLVGDGGTGKGTLIKLIVKLVGVDNCSHIDLDKLGERFQTWLMEGKLVNICPEGEPRRPVDEAMFKALVSGDRVTVERKFQDPHAMTPTARIISPMNKMPQVHDPTNAFFDRLLIFKFDQRFRRQVSTDVAGDGAPQADPELEAKLTAELPGIFNWALEGLRRLHERGRFDPPTSVLDRARDYRNSQSPVYRFLSDYPDKGEGRRISTATLYEHYVAWCRQAGQSKVLDKNVFGRKVSEAKYPGISKDDSDHDDRGFFGIGPGDGGGDLGKIVRFSSRTRRRSPVSNGSQFFASDEEDA